MEYIKDERKQLFIFTFVCMLALFIWEGHIAINLSDESFLWYGAKAVMHGQVPIRDFYAYDPGRYYLTALFMKLMGDDGIIASRIAEASIQGVGLFLSLCMLSDLLRKDNKWYFLYILLTALILLVWMVPLYKSFDIVASIVFIYILSNLIKNKTLTTSFMTGLVVSLVAIIGRNHGIYGLFASFSVIIYLKLTTPSYSLIHSLKWWLMGIFIGYLPIILMCVLIPGFGEAFFQGIFFLFVIKSTNLYVPIPWPWRVTNVRDFIAGLFLLSTLLFTISSLINLLIKFKNKNMSSIFIACTFLSLPYAHYIFSRANIIHLALGIFPFLIGTIAYLFQTYNRSHFMILTSLVVLFVFSGITALPLHPPVESYLGRDWHYINISGSQLKVDLDAQNKIAMFERLIKQYASDNQSFLVTPFNFGLYCIFDRKSPMWDVYPLFSRSFEEQAKDIVNIKKANPGFIVIYDLPLDNDPNRQFHNTHAHIFKYIADNFELIHDPFETANVFIYKRKN